MLHLVKNDRCILINYRILQSYVTTTTSVTEAVLIYIITTVSYSYPTILTREGMQGLHEPRKMFSKPPYSQMSIKNDLALHLYVRIDIIKLINNTF